MGRGQVNLFRRVDSESVEVEIKHRRIFGNGAEAVKYCFTSSPTLTSMVIRLDR